MTIVPTYDGEKRTFKNSSKHVFDKDSLCSHQTRFPMDARFGDKILFEVTKLENVRLVIALGSEFKSGKITEFLFTSNVNKQGGFLKFPYPYNGYMTLNYDDILNITEGEYEFSLTFLKGD